MFLPPSHRSFINTTGSNTNDHDNAGKIALSSDCSRSRSENNTYIGTYVLRDSIEIVDKATVLVIVIVCLAMLSECFHQDLQCRSRNNADKYDCFLTINIYSSSDVGGNSLQKPF